MSFNFIANSGAISLKLRQQQKRQGNENKKQQKKTKRSAPEYNTYNLNSPPTNLRTSKRFERIKPRNNKQNNKKKSVLYVNYGLYAKTSS